MALDCQTCGACCVNLPSNQAEGFTTWVEIEPDARLLTRRDLVRKLVTYDADGVPHLRISAGATRTTIAPRRAGASSPAMAGACATAASTGSIRRGER